MGVFTRIAWLSVCAAAVFIGGCWGRADAQSSLGARGLGGGRMEKATFAGGCFWGVEATFRKVKGVTATQVGYTGGSHENPTYEDVCGGKTGHAEAVELEYDADVVTYEELLAVFWKCHDPTTLNRQGPDVGSQYRSAIFYHTSEQEAEAKASKEGQQASGRYARPIVTEIVPATTFYRAEEYHQRYHEKTQRCGVPRALEVTQRGANSTSWVY